MSKKQNSANTKTAQQPESFGIPNYGDDELVRLSDFESIKQEFKVQNTTTKTEVKEVGEIQLIEIVDHGVILQLPRRSCANGHNLMVEMITTVPRKPKHRFAFTAKVEELATIGDSPHDKVTLTFLQFEETEWAGLCRLFASRQDEIMAFLKAARGY